MLPRNARRCKFTPLLSLDAERVFPGKKFKLEQGVLFDEWPIIGGANCINLRRCLL